MSIIQDSSRIWQLDLLKLFACFLVVWGHVIYSPTSCIENDLWRFLYSFHVSLFMMISGYFALSSKNRHFCNLFKKKFMQLLYPCVIWGCISFLLSYGFLLLIGQMQSLSLKKILSDFYWLSDFWFLKSCFICYIITYIGVKCFNKFVYFSISALLISQLISIYQVPFMYPVFYIGLLLRKYTKLLDFLIKIRFFIWLLFIVLSLCWTQDVWLACHDVPYAMAFSSTSAFIKFLLFRFFRHIIGITGALSFVVLFKMINNALICFKTIQFLCFCGKYTLEIYVISLVVFGNVRYLLSSFIAIPEFVNFYIVAPVFSIIIIVLSVFLARFLYRKEMISYLFWGRRRY